MGLGSKDQERRKDVKVAFGKSDWKAQVRGVADAEESIKIIKELLAKDPNGRLLLDSYTGLKLDQLEEYKKYCQLLQDQGQAPPTLKEYCKSTYDYKRKL